MATEKEKKKVKSIILYLDNIAAINCLSDANAGLIFKAILEYANTGKLPEFEQEGISALFMMFVAQIDRDTEAYIAKCEKNAENARKRYEAKKAANACDGNHTHTIECLSKSNPKNKSNSNSDDNCSNEHIIRGEIAQEPIAVVKTDYPFEMVWKVYDKPIGNQKKLRSLWNVLTEEEREQCFTYVSEYVKMRPQIYRKNFENFITSKTWLNEPLTFETNGTHFGNITANENKRDSASAAIGAMQRLLADNRPISEE